jgi:hypothetical protein
LSISINYSQFLTQRGRKEIPHAEAQRTQREERKKNEEVKGKKAR